MRESIPFVLDDSEELMVKWSEPGVIFLNFGPALVTVKDRLLPVLIESLQRLQRELGKQKEGEATILPFGTKGGSGRTGRFT